MNEMRKYIDIVEKCETMQNSECMYPPDDLLSPRGIEMRELCGDIIHLGDSRCVYQHKKKPNLVIKAEIAKTGMKMFKKCKQNPNEYRIWNNTKAKFPDFKQWLCPILEMSPCERFVIQPKCQKARVEDVPKRMPAFMTFEHNPDMDMKNVGMLNGKLVVFDYGIYFRIDEEGCEYCDTYVDWSGLIRNRTWKNRGYRSW